MFVLGGDAILNSFVELCSLGNFGWKYSQSLEEQTTNAYILRSITL